MFIEKLKKEVLNDYDLIINYIKDNMSESIISFSDVERCCCESAPNIPAIFKVEDETLYYSFSVDIDYYGYFKTQYDRVNIISKNEVIKHLKTSMLNMKEKTSVVEEKVEEQENYISTLEEFKKSYSSINKEKIQKMTEEKLIIAEYFTIENTLKYYKENNYLHVANACGSGEWAYQYSSDRFKELNFNQYINKLQELLLKKEKQLLNISIPVTLDSVYGKTNKLVHIKSL